MLERGLRVDHTTIYRWVQRYSPELDKRCRPHLQACNGSWRVDETYIKMIFYNTTSTNGKADVCSPSQKPEQSMFATLFAISYDPFILSAIPTSCSY